MGQTSSSRPSRGRMCRPSSTQMVIGMEAGLRALAKIKKLAIGIPVLTDVHEAVDVQRVAEIADVLQIPALLCRQTDLLVAAAKTGRAVNIKKGQFVAPGDMRFAVEKIRDSGKPIKVEHELETNLR